jgi:signal transduction histidine kinase
VVSLEKSKIFGQLKGDELAALKRMAREQTFAPGQEIFKEGDAGETMFVVKDGLVEISVLVGQNVRHVFSQVEPGDMFGEMAVLEDKPRSACAVARGETRVYVLPRKEVLNLVEHSPRLGLGFLREISRRLREFDRQYLREVLQAERLAVVGRFARSIVHDLKNPLNIIGLAAEMATLEKADAETRQNAVANIRQQVERISDLVGEIMDFTQSAPPDLILPPVNYGEFVPQALTELRAEAALKDVAIELKNEPPDVALLVNPKRLRRVYDNLVHNAMDAMPEGGRIYMRFESRPREVVTEIEDTGPGIAPEMTPQLFQAFATFGKMHGTGLGLSICKKILEDHHGWIMARNEQGRGAIFAFGLPKPKA